MGLQALQSVGGEASAERELMNTPTLKSGLVRCRATIPNGSFGESRFHTYPYGKRA